MKIIIKRAGRYNDHHGKAATYAAGDVLDTQRDYALSLIDMGFAAIPEPPAPPKKTTTRRRRTRKPKSDE